jgi:hypothetical protein
MLARRVVTVAVTVLVLALFSTSSAVVPQEINYQVMLTNDSDEPLTDQAVALEFTIFDAAEGGSPLWSELHETGTNSIGVVSVILGETSPLVIAFDQSLWLQVAVDGQVMWPRRELVAVTTARHAHDSELLGGVPAPSYALDNDLYQPGTLNEPSNPLEWTKLKNVPSGFADGVDDQGTGVSGSGTSGYVAKFTGDDSIGNSAIFEEGGRVSIGSHEYDSRLAVEQTGAAPALYLTNTSAAEWQSVLEIVRTEPLDGPNDGMLLLQFPFGSTDGDLIKCESAGAGTTSAVFVVSHNGGVSATGGLALTPPDHSYTLMAECNYASPEAQAVRGVYTGTGSVDATAVYGEAKPQDYYGIGAKFVGGYVGAMGLVEPTGGHIYVGVDGECLGGSGSNYGLFGYATGSGTNYGVFGNALYGSQNWAGYFAGDVRVTGTLVNPGPVLEIDHPSDPEGGYLRHALVSSPEMKTVYDGIAVLDARGEALVQLPDWFEDLNGEFRYQLTPIGAPAPDLYVAETVSSGRFRIAGGKPGMTVSWQLTGIRQDANARQHPVVVEEDKRPEDRGRYLDPEAHGAQEELGIGHRDGKTDGT